MSGRLFTLSGDTLEGRKWKVADGWLECEAMVPGGWKRVIEVEAGDDLNAAIVWLTRARLTPDSEREAA